MNRQKKPIKSDIGWSTSDRISIFGKDLPSEILARETGFSGPYVELIQLIAAEAEKASGKSLPINATGAIGAICCEMGFDWKICRGLGVMARAVGLVGHLLEESRNPMAAEIWHRVEDEASELARPK